MGCAWDVTVLAATRCAFRSHCAEGPRPLGREALDRVSQKVCAFTFMADGLQWVLMALGAIHDAVLEVDVHAFGPMRLSR